MSKAFYWTSTAILIDAGEAYIFTPQNCMIHRWIDCGCPGSGEIKIGETEQNEKISHISDTSFNSE